MTLLIVNAFLYSAWPAPALWLFCRCLPGFGPATRATLWCAACAQMLIVWLVASARCPAHAVGHWLPLWAVGVGGRLLILWTQFRRAGRLVREAIPAPDGLVAAEVARLSARLMLRRPPAVRVSARLKTPVLVGPLRPVLLTPGGLPEEGVGVELGMALAHELAHLRRRDLWLGLLPTLTQTMLFFHPLVWLAVREYVLSREEACDAEARHVTGTPSDEYGAMLLAYVAAARQPGRKTRSLSPQFHSPQFHKLTRRLNAMRIPYEQPKQGPVGAFCSVCLLGAVGASAFVMNGSAPAPTQVAVAPPIAVTASRVALLPQTQPVQAPTRPVSARTGPHGVLAHPAQARVADAVVTTPDPWKVARTRIGLRGAAITGRRVPPAAATHPTAATEAVMPASPQDVSEANKEAPPQSDTAPPMEVAWDAPPIPTTHDVTPDLSRMQSELQALGKQMRDQPLRLPQMPPLTTLPDKEFVKRLNAEMKAQFGPQSQHKWKQHDQELRAQIDAQLPSILAEAALARREAAQTQTEQFRRLVADAQRQAAAESAQARVEARQQAAQALAEMQKELPRIQEELQGDLQQPLPPAPPVATDGTPY